MAKRFLLHDGGEACIYRLQDEKSDLVLKQYKDGVSVDRDVIEKISACKVCGLYCVREAGVRDGSPYIVYDHVDGVASSEIERLPVVVAMLALRRVARTLGELEKIGVHHGDLSPSNVVFSSEGMSFKTTLIDFGIVGPGALSYAAPERFRGKVPDSKSDLFGLGMLLYRWISGAELIDARDCCFDEFASRMGQVDKLNLTERLYCSGKFEAGELSALEPLWAGLLKSDPEERFEDFEELDEVLEISIGLICGGEIALIKKERAFAEGSLKSLIEKMRQIVPAYDENSRKEVDLPPGASRAGKKFPVKISVLSGFVLILLIVLAILAFGSNDPDIDDVGELVLQKSRSLESASELDIKTGSDSGNILLDSGLLKDLPIPEQVR